MNREEVETSIKSFENRLKWRIEDVKKYVDNGDLWAAQIALGECIGFKAVIDELDFQLEMMEA